jgi:hypothetical protein
MGIIGTVKKLQPTKAETLGVIQKKRSSGQSLFAWFFFTFMGFDFYDHYTNKTLTKSQVFWRDTKEAKTMCKTLVIPKRYTLVKRSTNSFENVA